MILITFSSLEDLDEAANSARYEEGVAEWLRKRGYTVEKARIWEEPREFCSRLGIHIGTLSRKLKDPRCPKIDICKGKCGKRTLFLAATPSFEKFITQHKHHAKKH